MREKKSNKLKETKEKYNHINARGGFFFFFFNSGGFFFFFSDIKGVFGECFQTAVFSF